MLLHIALKEVLRQLWALWRCWRQSGGTWTWSLLLTACSVVRRWSCCLIRWRYDGRKRWSGRCVLAHHNVAVLDTGVFTCILPFIQPWPGPVGLLHVWQFRYKSPSSAIYIWSHRQMWGRVVALVLLFDFAPRAGKVSTCAGQLREQVWWLSGRSRKWCPIAILCCTRLHLFAFI